VPRAVAVAAVAARPGDVVLLAPGCASFDQYSDFTARGRDFQAAVGQLGGSSPAEARDA
jgi:UDP-N-acetylmuramoylalanine--D-glutamate ligase